MNNAILGGVVSSPPQLRYGQDILPIIDFELSFVNPSKSESLKDIKCIAYGKLAESISKLEIGQALIIVGSINNLSADINGQKKYWSQFKIDSVQELNKTVNVNKINIVGRTGKDVEMKYFESGNNKALTSLAVRRTKDQTDWFNIELWGKTAEVAGNYVRKGGLIGIEGQIKIEEWTDKNSGETRSKLLVNGTQLELLGSKQTEEEHF